MNIRLIDRAGESSNYELVSLSELYDQLIAEMKIDAICGGACSCATCHVYVDENAVQKLTPCSDEEDSALDGLMSRKPNSRLLCQLSSVDGCEQLSIELAPEE